MIFFSFTQSYTKLQRNPLLFDLSLKNIFKSTVSVINAIFSRNGMISILRGVKISGAVRLWWSHHWALDQVETFWLLTLTTYFCHFYQPCNIRPNIENGSGYKSFILKSVTSQPLYTLNQRSIIHCNIWEKPKMPNYHGTLCWAVVSIWVTTGIKDIHDSYRATQHIVKFLGSFATWQLGRCGADSSWQDLWFRHWKCRENKVIRPTSHASAFLDKKIRGRPKVRFGTDLLTLTHLRLRFWKCQ